MDWWVKISPQNQKMPLKQEKMPLKQQNNAGNARKMLLMLAFFFKNPLSVKNAFLMPAQLPDA